VRAEESDSAAAACDRGKGLIGGVRILYFELGPGGGAGEDGGVVAVVGRSQAEVGGLGAGGEGEHCRGCESRQESALEHRPSFPAALVGGRGKPQSGAGRSTKLTARVNAGLAGEVKNDRPVPPPCPLSRAWG
jgi:hypothetical protein